MKQIKHYLITLLLAIMPVIGLHAQNRVVNFPSGTMTVRQAFEVIEHQLGMTIAYNESLLDVNRQVTPPSGKPVLETMTAILDGTGMQASIDGKMILIVKADRKAAAPVEYKGKIVDASGPVPGAMIMLDGKKDNVAMTDIDGQFSIQATPGRTFVVSMMGYKDYTSRFGSQTAGIVINLEEDIDLLEESVVVGYGVQKKVNLTGAVGVISGKDLNNRPVTNAAQALQGADPSLLMSMSSGSIEGKQYNVKIRGQVSLNSGSPLILVDGIESSLTQVNPNDIESVSVLKDASSCAIYGATASAGVVLITTKSGKSGDLKVTYNGRGGVAFNTTRTDFVTTGYDYVTLSNEFTKNSPKGYNAWNYTDEEMQMLYDRRFDKTENADRPWVYTNEKGKYRYLGNFDWYGYVLKRTRPETEHNVTINGGNDKINYYVSGRYLYREGVFNNASEDILNGYSFRAKVNAKVKPWLRYTGNLSYEGSAYNYGGFWEQDGSEDLKSEGILWNITQNISPTIVPVNPDGTTTMYTNGIQFADSPIASGRGGVFTDGRNKNSRKVGYWVVTNRLVFDLTKWLNITADYTYRRRDNLNSYRSYPTANTWDKNMKKITEMTNGSIYDFYQEGRSYLNGHVANAYLNVNKSWGQHNLTAVAGAQLQDYRSSTSTIRQKGSISDKLAFINMAQGTIERADESNTAYRTLGFFARVNYDYAGKYLFEISGRQDGSSRFARGNRWAFYPSASAGWRISEEKFWGNLKSWWDNAKIRVSYGSLGNQQVSNYSYISTLSTSMMNYTFDSTNLAGKVSTPGAITEGLTWETVITYNLGFDLGFLSNRLTASADFYIRDTKDMLTSSQELPAVFGTSSPKINGADLRTKGYEITLTWKDQVKLAGRPFYYSVSGSLGDYVTTITKFDNPTKSLSQHYVGKRLGEIWGYQVEGLFKTDAEAAEYQAKINDRAVNNSVYSCNVAALAKLKAGDVKFVDRNGDGVINTDENTVGKPGDRYIIGNSLPRYTYSFRGDIDWYGFNLSVFFQGVGHCDWMPPTKCSYFWSLYGFPASSFVPTDFESKTWTEDRRNAYFPRRRGYTTYSGSALGVNTDRYLQNAAYIRLKNITLGYTIPIKQNKAVEKVRIYATGENLWYWSPMKRHSKYIDPEVATASSNQDADCIYPFSRTVSLGIDITF